MNPERIEEEIQKNGNRKIVLGVRVFPEFKEKVIQNALKLRISMSEFAENILVNNDDLLIDKNAAIKENNLLKRQVAELKNKLHISNANHEAESESLNKHIAELQSYVSLVKGQVAIHQDKRLLHLLAQIHGKRDTIETSEGQKVAITYNTTNDLLIAMIYSFQIKKLELC